MASSFASCFNFSLVKAFTLSVKAQLLKMLYRLSYFLDPMIHFIRSEDDRLTKLKKTSNVKKKKSLSKALEKGHFNKVLMIKSKTGNDMDIDSLT